ESGCEGAPDFLTYSSGGHLFCSDGWPATTTSDLAGGTTAVIDTLGDKIHATTPDDSGSGRSVRWLAALERRKRVLLQEAVQGSLSAGPLRGGCPVPGAGPV